MTIENYFERRIRPIVDDSKDNTTDNQNQNYENFNHVTNIKNITTKSNTNNNIIDEDQLARTFQEIVNCINLDDDDENNSDSLISNNNFSRSNFHHSHHSLLPEFKSIFGGANSSFNITVGRGENKTKTTSSSGNNGLGRSFLDEDWYPIPIKKSGNEEVILRSRSVAPSSTSTLVNNTRPMTPNSSISSSFNTNHRNNNEYFLRDGNSYNNVPPNDYICKLCNCDGHWMKDCRLYEPRTPPSSISSFKSTSSNSNISTGIGTNNRTLLPPGNYVCRLCNVAGHWIDQCSKFQPKNDTTDGNTYNNPSTPPVLPPMLGPGPTPNYRPPAYLSKPVPSNYICNLCNRPGHWIQQCTEFTPIINHKPSVGKY
jgi:hypothetical protein